MHKQVITVYSVLYLSVLIWLKRRYVIILWCKNFHHSLRQLKSTLKTVTVKQEER